MLMTVPNRTNCPLFSKSKWFLLESGKYTIVYPAHTEKKQGVAALKGLPLIRRNVRQNISLSNLLPRPGSTQNIVYTYSIDGIWLKLINIFGASAQIAN